LGQILHLKLGVPTLTNLLPLPDLVPEQEHLPAYVATVLGNIEYREWKQQLERIHELLDLSRVEETFQRLSLARRNGEEERAAGKENRPFRALSQVEQASYQRLCSQALRSNVARSLTGDSFRDFGCRLSESTLLQWFCKLDRIDTVRIPSKSALQRYSQWLEEEDLRQVIDTLLGAASDGEEGSEQTLELSEALNLEAYFLDTTCVKLHIHFPVDSRVAEGRRPNVDESDEADPQAGLESADGRAGRVSEADEPVVHEDDPRPAAQGLTANPESDPAGDEEAEQADCGARRAAPG